MSMSVRISETIIYKQTMFEHLFITIESKKNAHTYNPDMISEDC